MQEESGGHVILKGHKAGDGLSYLRLRRCRFCQFLRRSHRKAAMLVSAMEHVYQRKHRQRTFLRDDHDISQYISWYQFKVL